MKTIFIIGMLLIGNSQAHSQDLANEFKLLTDSAILLKYLEIQKSNNINKNYFDDLYLINEQGQSLTPPKNLFFKGVNVYDTKNRKLIKRGIHAWKVVAILNNNQIIVTIIDFYITYKNSNYDFVNSGGAKVIFEFSCDKKRWQLVTYKSGGV